MEAEQAFEQWATRFVAAIAQEIRRYRQEHGLSVQQLSDKLAADYGMAIKRSVLSNLENGRRHMINVPELMVLAHCLRVPPLMLVCPVGTEKTMEILPGRTIPTWDAAQWVSAEAPLVHDKLPDRDEWLVDVEDVESWQHGAMPARLYREHDRLIARRNHALLNAGGAYYAADTAEREGRTEEAAGHRSRAAAEKQTAREAEDALRAHRHKMRGFGFTILPALPRDLAHLDGDFSPAAIEASLAAMMEPLPPPDADEGERAAAD
jgi:transcriptional regulator with XRE-family HTH domain